MGEPRFCKFLHSPISGTVPESSHELKLNHFPANKLNIRKRDVLPDDGPSCLFRLYHTAYILQQKVFAINKNAD